MKAWQGEVILETGRIAEVNPALSPGQITETVTVSETIPLVTTTDPTDASTLDSTRIKELPINGRDLNTLLGDVTPGVEPVIDSQRRDPNERPDGVLDQLHSGRRGFEQSRVRWVDEYSGAESIAEVRRVETSTSSAKYTAPTSVIVTTKGGANTLQLAVYETARNNAFGVARARQDISFTSTPYQTPKLIRNEFGGSIRGPVFIHKVYNGRNRTFFSFSREGA